MPSVHACGRTISTSPESRDRFVISVCAALMETGYVAKDYASHSFHIGAMNVNKS